MGHIQTVEENQPEILQDVVDPFHGDIVLRDCLLWGHGLGASQLGGVDR